VIDQLYWAGKWDEFLSQADGFIAACEAGDRHYAEAYMRIDRASLRLARADVDGALNDLWKGLDRAREAGDPQAYVPTFGQAIHILVDVGRLEDAQTLANELLPDLGSAIGRPWMVWDVIWVADRVGLEQPLRDFLRNERTSWGRRVLSVLEGDFENEGDESEKEGRLTTAALARLQTAERLVLEGRRAEADVHLQKALAFYRSVGATRYVRRGEALLAAAS
jgi:hypothetical protein